MDSLDQMTVENHEEQALAISASKTILSNKKMVLLTVLSILASGCGLDLNKKQEEDTSVYPSYSAPAKTPRITNNIAESEKFEYADVEPFIKEVTTMLMKNPKLVNRLKRQFTNLKKRFAKKVKPYADKAQSAYDKHSSFENKHAAILNPPDSDPLELPNIPQKIKSQLDALCAAWLKAQNYEVEDKETSTLKIDKNRTLTIKHELESSHTPESYTDTTVLTVSIKDRKSNKTLFSFQLTHNDGSGYNGISIKTSNGSRTINLYNDNPMNPQVFEDNPQSLQALVKALSKIIPSLKFLA